LCFLGRRVTSRCRIDSNCWSKTARSCFRIYDTLNELVVFDNQDNGHSFHCMPLAAEYSVGITRERGFRSIEPLKIELRIGESLSLLTLQPSHQTRPAPKFNVVAVRKALGLGHGFSIALTKQQFETDKTPVHPDRKHPVFYHPEGPY
jgi:hypothetical protein